MKNSQVNFRIDSELLNEIKQAAEAVSKPYSQWIIEVCQEKLGKKTISLEEITEQLQELERRLNQLEEQADEKKKPGHKNYRSNHSQKGLTHTELGRLLSVNASTVSRWATGKRKTPQDLEYKFDKTLKLWVR